MSDTPRTDAIVAELVENTFPTPETIIHLAGELERENAALRKIRNAADELIEYSESGSEEKWLKWEDKFDALKDLLNAARKEQP